VRPPRRSILGRTANWARWARAAPSTSATGFIKGAGDCARESARGADRAVQDPSARYPHAEIGDQIFAKQVIYASGCPTPNFVAVFSDFVRARRAAK